MILFIKYKHKNAFRIRNFFPVNCIPNLKKKIKKINNNQFWIWRKQKFLFKNNVYVLKRKKINMVINKIKAYTSKRKIKYAINKINMNFYFTLNAYFSDFGGNRQFVGRFSIDLITCLLKYV